MSLAWTSDKFGPLHGTEKIVCEQQGGSDGRNLVLSFAT